MNIKIYVKVDTNGDRPKINIKILSSERLLVGCSNTIRGQKIMRIQYVSETKENRVQKYKNVEGGMRGFVR